MNLLNKYGNPIDKFYNIKMINFKYHSTLFILEKKQNYNQNLIASQEHIHLSTSK